DRARPLRTFGGARVGDAGSAAARPHRVLARRRPARARRGGRRHRPARGGARPRPFALP
ncbi:MAG: hypothetical protein AVDCRST_MAG89-5073, partial [uncultured Gemmatimonadetes bacterium]